jgi:hypothetical protein
MIAVQVPRCAYGVPLDFSRLVRQRHDHRDLFKRLQGLVRPFIWRGAFLSRRYSLIPLWQTHDCLGAAMDVGYIAELCLKVPEST